MLDSSVRPYASCIWNWGKSQLGSNLISIERELLLLTLLPRTTGRFSRWGLKANNLRYKNDDFTEQYLRGGSVKVAYNPDNVSCVWALIDGVYKRFILAESRFADNNVSGASNILARQKLQNKALQSELIQSKIDLANHIEAISIGIANTKDVRSTRKKEEIKAHTDYMKGEM